MLQLLLSISLSQIAVTERLLTSSLSACRENDGSVLADLSTGEEVVHSVSKKPLFHGFLGQKSHHFSF